MNDTILNDSTDLKNFALGVAAALAGIAAITLAKKKVDKVVWKYVSGEKTLPEQY